MKDIVVNHFLNYEFVYIYIFLFITFLLISISINHKLTRKISIFLSSVFFILCGFEFGLSFVLPFAEMNYHREYMKLYDINNVSQKRHNKWILNEQIYETYINDINDIKDYDKLIFDKIYSIYANNTRFTMCNGTSQDIYIFFGCSFIFGLGLNDDETLPYFFSKIFNFNKKIINFGVSGHSTNAALNIINNELYLPLINNKNSKIKHCFYSLIDDHIYRNFRYEGFCLDGYLYKDNKWYIPTAIGKTKWIFARSYIFRKVFVPVIDEYFKQYYENYMIKTLEEMNKIVEEKYASKLTVIVWPNIYDKKFIKKLKTINLDFIFLPGYFDSETDGYTITDDGHPTAKANEEIAEILYNHINKTHNLAKENKEN